MKDRTKKHLFDILTAIEDAQVIVANTETLEDYLDNRIVQLAIERLLGIIGEATSRLEKENAQVLFGQVRQIMGLRNRIVHEYDDLDETMIWQTIHESLPILKREVKS